MRVIPQYPLEQFAADLNDLASFLALCDFSQGVPNARSLQRLFGTNVVDVLVLLGNSVLVTAERAFAAMQAGFARRLLIAGGHGHATPFLERSLRGDRRYSAVVPDGRSEAELLGEVATRFWQIAPDRMMLETASSNCGENARFALRTLQAHRVQAETLILVQDPIMQRRTDAGFRKVWREAGLQSRFANYSAWVPQVRVRNGDLEFTQPASGCWPMERFVSLVMGEIPRLRDDAAGYGPRGRGFIEHVAIPETVLAAYERLADRYPEFVRPH